jgi:hypothetical protein
VVGQRNVCRDRSPRLGGTSLARPFGHLAHGDLQSRAVDHSSVALISLFVSGGDPPECSEAVEEVLDEVPLAKSVKVAFDLLLWV